MLDMSYKYKLMTKSEKKKKKQQQQKTMQQSTTKSYKIKVYIFTNNEQLNKLSRIEKQRQSSVFIKVARLFDSVGKQRITKEFPSVDGATSESSPAYVTMVIVCRRH